eukprot:509915-Pyramimonas_sp.AAC.1
MAPQLARSKSCAAACAHDSARRCAPIAHWCVADRRCRLCARAWRLHLTPTQTKTDTSLQTAA